MSSCNRNQVELVGVFISDSRVYNGSWQWILEAANVASKEPGVDSLAGVDVQELALFDVEFLFLRARAKSIGEKLQLRVSDEDGTQVETELNVDSVKVQRDPDHTDIIKISDDVTLKMKYPDLHFFAEGVKVDTIHESTETMARCVSQIVVGEEVYSREDMTSEEIVEWLDGLTTEQYSKIMKFFETMPKLTHTIKLKNRNTGENFEVVLEGLADFF